MKIALPGLLLLFPFFAYALTPSEIREKIREQVTDRHPTPPADFWESLGPEALPVIRQMLSEGGSAVQRSWLIDGLGHFDDSSVAAILEKEIKESGNAVFQKKMLSSLIRSQGDASYDFVEPYLADADPHVRLAVAKGMKEHMSSGKASERLLRFADAEKEPWVKEEWAKSPASPPPRMPGGRLIRLIGSPGPDSAKSETKEEDLSGEWSGVLMTAGKTIRCRAVLSRKGTAWKAEFKLSKPGKVGINTENLEVIPFRSARLRWIELRSKKDDAVFLGKKERN